MAEYEGLRSLSSELGTYLSMVELERVRSTYPIFIYPPGLGRSLSLVLLGLMSASHNFAACRVANVIM